MEGLQLNAHLGKSDPERGRKNIKGKLVCLVLSFVAMQLLRYILKFWVFFFFYV